VIPRELVFMYTCSKATMDATKESAECHH